MRHCLGRHTPCIRPCAGASTTQNDRLARRAAPITAAISHRRTWVLATTTRRPACTVPPAHHAPRWHGRRRAGRVETVNAVHHEMVVRFEIDKTVLQRQPLRQRALCRCRAGHAAARWVGIPASAARSSGRLEHRRRSITESWTARSSSPASTGMNATRPDESESHPRRQQPSPATATCSNSPRRSAVGQIGFELDTHLGRHPIAQRAR